MRIVTFFILSQAEETLSTVPGFPEKRFPENNGQLDAINGGETDDDARGGRGAIAPPPPLKPG